VVNATPWPLYPRERPGTHCARGLVGLRAGLVGCGKCHLPPGFDPRTVHPVASPLYRLSYPGPREGRSLFHIACSGMCSETVQRRLVCIHYMADRDVHCCVSLATMVTRTRHITRTLPTLLTVQRELGLEIEQIAFIHSRFYCEVVRPCRCSEC
jgi:hypothetical protein